MHFFNLLTINMLLFCFPLLGMESQELSTPTINDLRKIAREVGVENLKGNEGVKDILHHIKDQVYSAKISDSEEISTSDALELGSYLLETAITFSNSR